MATLKRINLMLVENVENLGIVGDVVDVRPGYARNYLLPHGLAVPPTEGARKKVEERRKAVEAELAALQAQQQAIFDKLQELEISIKRSANEDGLLYGSVTTADIVEALAEEGVTVSERAIRIGSTIKHLDSYPIPVQLTKELKTEIKLWVVSDKPAEELMAEELAKGEEEAAAEENKGDDTPNFRVPDEANN